MPELTIESVAEMFARHFRIPAHELIGKMELYRQGKVAPQFPVPAVYSPYSALEFECKVVRATQFPIGLAG